MPLKPRIKIVGPTSDVMPGTADGFPRNRGTAQGTPIRLRITDDVEQNMMFWLAWTSASIALRGLQIIDAAIRKRLFERAPLRVVLNGEVSDYAALVAAIKSEYPSTKVLAYVNTQVIPESPPARPRIVSLLFQHFYDNRTTELLKLNSGLPKITLNPPVRRLFVDITQTGVINYLAGEDPLSEEDYAIPGIVGDYGSDGIAIDTLRTEVVGPGALQNGNEKDAAWPLQAREVVNAIDAALDAEFGSGTKEIWFNGLWNDLQDGLESLTIVDFTFTADAATDNLTKSSHGLQTGDGPVRVFSSITLPSPLGTGTDVDPPHYWVIWVDLNTFRLALSRDDAFSGLQINILSSGSGVHTLSDTATTSRAGQLTRQEKALLPSVAGASVEWFGRTGKSASEENFWIGEDGFRIHAKEIGERISANPTKPILVRGAVPDGYYHYVADLQNARYAYACYLTLAWTTASTFQFNHNFQVPRPAGPEQEQRANGMAVHSYLELPLGSTAGPAEELAGGGFMREFDGGWVFLAPDGLGVQEAELTADLWTTRGQFLASGSVLDIAEGDAVILLKDEPPPHPYRLRATITESSTEWIMETVTSEYRYRRLRARVRSPALSSCLLVRVQVNETDFSLPARPFAILQILPTGGTFTSLPRDYAYGMTPYLRAVHAIAQNAYVADGQWCEFDIDLLDEFAPLRHFQIHSVRAMGDIDVELLELYEPESVLSLIGPNAPLAKFTHVTNGLEITFTDTSTPGAQGTIASRFWDFGDGVTSTTTNPVHAYQFPGAKSVTLTVTDSFGSEATYSTIAVPDVATDGPGVVLPESQAEFIAVRLMPA